MIDRRVPFGAPVRCALLIAFHRCSFPFYPRIQIRSTTYGIFRGQPFPACERHNEKHQEKERKKKQIHPQDKGVYLQHLLTIGVRQTAQTTQRTLFLSLRVGLSSPTLQYRGVSGSTMQQRGFRALIGRPQGAE